MSAEKAGQEEPLSPRAIAKASLIEEILNEDDLYKVLGASRNASPAEIRRCYLERGKICHPDKIPYHPDSTSAFQRLGFAFDVLKSPSSRRTYDRASRDPILSSKFTTSNPTAPFLDGEISFRSAVESIFTEFLDGDFTHVRQLLETLNRSYPNLVSNEVIDGIESAFFKIRQLVITTRVYAFLISIELGRIHRVQKRLMALGYLDVRGRVRVTMQLVRTTLAIPVRIELALRRRKEREWRAKTAGWNAIGRPPEDEGGNNVGGILNDRVFKVLELLVGSSAEDEAEDIEYKKKSDPRNGLNDHDMGMGPGGSSSHARSRSAGASTNGRRRHWQ
ncbi:hypothetical protein TWF192_009294 [Orbilia oligospora]|uniref:J domain-containing protein n=1 Tax=Orbilia oligospora TaxID=2813651 RepID=A0A6G1M1Z6_ORBOL|nr:hypothetical protein TWF679_004932 [Orbilia oligospora]KAF3212686.1 hypothetical protein TWF191_010431 [Orbilia oligospora]KAF3241040.1 hypothetical protein TWF192_009294 [Orbilia oligospora]